MSRKTELNTVAIVLGLVAAVTAAGVLGRIFCGRQSSDEPVREVQDILSQCYATIGDMDRALHSAGS